MFFSLVAEKKKLLLADKYQELKKSGKLDNFLSKKRKRNAGKDRRKLPQSHKDSWQNLTEFNWNRKKMVKTSEFCNDWCPPAGGTLSQMVALCLSHSMSFCIIIALDVFQYRSHVRSCMWGGQRFSTWNWNSSSFCHTTVQREKHWHWSCCSMLKSLSQKS